MESLAPLIDHMQELVREELPAPQTCKLRLWDDGTFNIQIYHYTGDDRRQLLGYERTTSEILCEDVRGARWKGQLRTRNETLYESEFDDVDIRVITTIEPPNL